MGSVTPRKARGSGGLAVVGAVLLVSGLATCVLGDVQRRRSEAGWHPLIIAGAIMVACGLVCCVALIVVLVAARSRRRWTGQGGAEADWGLDSASDWQSPSRLRRMRSPRGPERPLPDREFRDWEQPRRPPRRQPARAQADWGEPEQERPEWGRPEPPAAYRPAAESPPPEDPLAESGSRERQPPSSENEPAPERESRQYPSGNGLRAGRVAGEAVFPGDRAAPGRSDAQHPAVPESVPESPAADLPSPQQHRPRGLPLLPYAPPSPPQPDMSPGHPAEYGRVMPAYPSDPRSAGPASRPPAVPGSPPGPAAPRPAVLQASEVTRMSPRYVPIPGTDAGPGPRAVPAGQVAQPEPARQRSWFEAIPRPQEPPVPAPEARIGQAPPSGPVAGLTAEPPARPAERPAPPAESPRPAAVSPQPAVVSPRPAQPELPRPDSGTPLPSVTTGHEVSDDTCPLPVILPGRRPAPAAADQDPAPAGAAEPPPMPAAATAPAPDVPSPAPSPAPAVRDSGLEPPPDPGPHRTPGEYADSATQPG